MAWYYICPPEGISFKIDVNSLADALHQSWLDITIDDVPSSSVVLSWEITWIETVHEIKHKKLVAGTLYADLQKIFIMGDIDACISFALWYRALIPLENRLLLQDHTQENVIELKVNTRSVEITKAFAPEINQIQQEILYILERSNGKLTTNRLLKVLREIFANLPEESFSVQVETAFIDLWGKNLISSPGTKWTPVNSQGVHSTISDYEAVQYELTLTDKGQLALKAQK
jgi:hypothetical protein